MTIDDVVRLLPPTMLRTLIDVTSESDEAVWRQVLDGDPDPFGVIWDRHHGRVYAHLVSAGARSDAEDLTAMVFLELWRKQHRVRFVEGSMLGWLLRTATNLYSNHTRAARRYRVFLDRLQQSVGATTAPSADHGLAERDEAHRTLAQVAAIDRQLLVATSEGASVRQAAQLVGISEPAAKMRLSRTRQRLREATPDDGSRRAIMNGEA